MLCAEMINALNIVATSVKSSWVYAGTINAMGGWYYKW